MEEQYNYNGEKFLDKLYKDLFNSEIVEHTKEKSDSRQEAIKKYMDRLEKVHENATTENKKNRLKRLYYDKYIIKEENIPNHLSKAEKKQIIEIQKKSLDKWLDYLTDENARYPMWAKYWVFQGMLKMGTYDEAHEVYQNRSKKTLAPFVDANPEIIAKAIEILQKQLNKENIEDEEIKKIIETGSFSKIYTILTRNYKKNISDNESTDGIWIKYNEGYKEDAIKLSKSLEGKNTGWCTASEEMAIDQVCGGQNYPGGDFYVYYTKDNENNYTNPRIAIRMDQESIGEIRGIEESQNMEECMIPILEEKLKKMKFLKKVDIKKYLEIIDDLKILSLINKKIANNEELTEHEILKLNYKKFGFGWEQDPRVENIQKKCMKSRNPETIKNMLKINPEIAKFIDEEILNEHPEILMEAVKPINSKLKSTIEKFSRKEMDEVKLDEKILLHICYDHVLKYLSDEFKNSHPEIMIEAVKQNRHPNANALCYVSESYMQSHPEIVLEALNQDVSVLKYVSNRFMQSHPETIMKAVKQNPDILFKISKDFIQSNPETIMKAVKQKVSLLVYLGEPFLELYPEIVMEAVKQNGSSLAFVSKKFQENHPEIVMEALKQKSSVLEYVSEEFIQAHPKIVMENVIKCLINKEVRNLNQKNVLEAARKDISAFARLNAGLQKDYPEITWEKLKEFEQTLEYVSEKFKKDESNKVCNTTKEYAPSLTFVSEEFQENHPEIVMETVKQDGSSLAFVSKKFQENHPEIVMEAIKEYAPSLEYVSEKFQKDHPEIVFELVRQDSSLLEYVSEKFQKAHPKMVFELVRQDGSLLEYVSEEFIKKYPEIAMEAVKEYAPSLEYINKEFQKNYPEIVMEAVRQDGFTLEYVSEEFKNLHPEIVMEAIKQDADALKYVGEEFKNLHPEIIMEEEKQTSSKHK